MHPLLRNLLAVLAGFIVGSAVNMALVNISGSIIPPPEGSDMTSMEGLKAAMERMGPRHYVFPFLAHALGTLAGALLTAKLAVTHRLGLAMIIGVIFLIGGSMMVMSLPSPLWFNVLDLAVAYIPMAYIGGKLGSGKST